MNLQHISFDQINPAPYNPRKNLKPGDPEYDKLKRSIDEFGCVEPLVWNQRSGNLVGGHQRLKVLIEQGQTETDVSVVDLPPERERALNVALNKISGDWEALIKTAIRKQLGSQQEQAAERRVECEAEIERIDHLVRNLLDHIKVSNRDTVNQRLDELSRERDTIESQLASLNQALLEDDEIQELVAETIAFAASLDSTLHHGSPDQRRTALRRCVDGVVIDHPNKRAELKLRVLPIRLDSRATASTKTVIVKLTKKSSTNDLQDEPTE